MYNICLNDQERTFAYIVFMFNYIHVFIVFMFNVRNVRTAIRSIYF